MHSCLHVITRCQAVAECPLSWCSILRTDTSIGLKNRCSLCQFASVDMVFLAWAGVDRHGIGRVVIDQAGVSAALHALRRICLLSWRSVSRMHVSWALRLGCCCCVVVIVVVDIVDIVIVIVIVAVECVESWHACRFLSMCTVLDNMAAMGYSVCLE